MGLDIVAHSKIEPVTDLPEDEDDRYEAGFIRAYVLTGFDQSLRGLEDGQWYRSTGDTLHFCAGSYSGYNHFREALSRAVYDVDPATVWANPDAYRDRPFFELINFADNEGTIGPEAAADLAADFDEWADTVHERLDDDYYRAKYDEWRAAFHLAAGSGLVNFR